MIEMPQDATKEDWARVMVRKNHGDAIAYRLEMVLERLKTAQRIADLPDDDKNQLTDIEAKVKAALDAVKQWHGQEEDSGD